MTEELGWLASVAPLSTTVYCSCRLCKLKVVTYEFYWIIYSRIIDTIHAAVDTVLPVYYSNDFGEDADDVEAVEKKNAALANNAEAASIKTALPVTQQSEEGGSCSRLPNAAILPNNAEAECVVDTTLPITRQSKEGNSRSSGVKRKKSQLSNNAILPNDAADNITIALPVTRQSQEWGSRSRGVQRKSSWLPNVADILTEGRRRRPPGFYVGFCGEERPPKTKTKGKAVRKNRKGAADKSSASAETQPADKSTTRGGGGGVNSVDVGGGDFQETGDDYDDVDEVGVEPVAAEEMEERGPYSAEYQSELKYLVDNIHKPSAEEVSNAKARMMQIDKEEADELGEIDNQTRNPDVPEEPFKALMEMRRNLVKHKARKERCTLQTTLDCHSIHICYDKVIRWSSTSSSASAGAPSVRMYPGSSSSAAPTAPASSRDATSTGA